MNPFISKVTILLAFLNIVSLMAQTPFVLTGQILDTHNRQPLSGANIYVRGTPVGTTSAKDGRFELRFNVKITPQDTLVIGYLGYRERHIAVKDFRNGMQIYLLPENLHLHQTITVYGERVDLTRQEIPHAVQILDSIAIRTSGSSEVHELIKNIPAVRLSGNQLDGEHIEIRGSSASEVNVYLDGILLNNLSSEHQADLALIPTEQIQRLEIIKGGSLALFGQGAFGGAVNIRSRQKQTTGLSLALKGGSFDSRHISGAFSLPLGNRFFINYFGQWKHMQPEIEFFPGEQYDAKTANAQIVLERYNHYLNAAYIAPFGQFNGYFMMYGLGYDKPQWQDRRKSYIASLQYRGKDDLSIILSHTMNRDSIDRSIVASTHYLSAYDTRQINLRLQKEFKLRRASWIFSGDYFHEELNNRQSVLTNGQETPYYQANLYDNRAGLSSVFNFADQYDSTGNLNWRVFLGIRGDISASGHRDVTNFWGARLNHRKHNRMLTLYINYGKNVKYPTLFEQAYLRNLVNIFPADTVQRQLKPEYNNSYEVGLRWFQSYEDYFYKTFEINGALFVSTTYNKIIRQPYGIDFFQTQTGRNNTSGAELSASFNKIFNYFRLTASALKLKVDNPQLYSYKPQERYNLQLSTSAPSGLLFDAQIFYEGKSYAWYYSAQKQRHTATVPAHSDMDISLGYLFNFKSTRFKIQISGHNIFDRSGYLYYYLYKRRWQLALLFDY